MFHRPCRGVDLARRGVLSHLWPDLVEAPTMVHGEGTPPSPSESSKAASEKSPPPAPSSARDLLTAISASAPWKNDSSASVSASSAASAMERARRQAPARIRRWLTRNGRWHATGAPFTGLACPASHLLTLPSLWNLTLPQEKNQELRDSCHGTPDGDDGGAPGVGAERVHRHCARGHDCECT